MRKLHTHDRVGHPIDEVENRPPYHALMKVAFWNSLQSHVGSAIPFEDKKVLVDISCYLTRKQ